VTGRPAHAKPEPLAGSLEAALERLRHKLQIVPAGTLDDPRSPEVELRERWRRLCPPRWRAATLESLDVTLRRDTSAWLDRLRADPTGAGNLLLLGAVGVGKTWAALALAHAALPCMTARFAPVPALLEGLRPDGGGRLDWYIRTGLLILDDLGAERLTDWGAEQLHLIVNGRWMHQRPIVATSNLDRDQIAAAVGARTWDRLRDGATAVALAGASRRRPRGEE
jgi:hypothetical protein